MLPKKKLSGLSLSEWIEAEGVAVVAGALRTTDSAVRHWRRGFVLPRPEQMLMIRKLSRGKVSFDETLESHFSSKNKKNRWKP